MTKVAIKNENITSFGGIYHIMGIFQSWVLKDKDDKQQADIFGVICTYRCILTNNRTSIEKGIITFYNERGASEKNFDIRTMTLAGRICPFHLWLRTWFS